MFIVGAKAKLMFVVVALAKLYCKRFRIGLLFLINFADEI
jgi:hypothetical protein